jgi:iron complex outermembrane receptor protein
MKMLLPALLGVALACTAVGARAQVHSSRADRQVHFVIESQNLADALNHWAHQSGFKLFCPNWDTVQQVSAPNLKGKYTVRNALNQLLAGTPLTYEFVTDKIVTVRTRAHSDSALAEGTQ